MSKDLKTIAQMIIKTKQQADANENLALEFFEVAYTHAPLIAQAFLGLSTKLQESEIKLNSAEKFAGKLTELDKEKFFRLEKLKTEVTNNEILSTQLNVDSYLLVEGLKKWIDGLKVIHHMDAYTRVLDKDTGEQYEIRKLLETI